MKKTTMTVAAFMAVSAVSYADTVTNKGGNLPLEDDGQKSKEVTFEFEKEGLYKIHVLNEKGEDVDFTATQGKNSVLNETLGVKAGEKVAFTVTLTNKVPKDTKLTVTFEPVTPEWVSWQNEQQTILTNLMSATSNLSQGTEKLGTADEQKVVAEKRSALIERVSTYQGVKNNFGVDEYNEWKDNKSVAKLEGLDQLQKDVQAATENDNAFKNALAKYETAKLPNGKLDYTKLTDAYEELDNKKLFETAYNTLKSDIDKLEEQAWNSFYGGTAVGQDWDKKITDLNERIKKLQAAISGGDENIANWAAVNEAVSSAMDNYNTMFNDLYEQLASKKIPAGYGLDIYEAEYNDAVAELNKILTKITAVKTANNDAKTAYEADPENEKNNIKGLDSYEGWSASCFEEELKEVYNKYINNGYESGGVKHHPIGVKDTSNPNTLRGKYKSLMNTVKGLEDYLAKYDSAKKDTDTDKNGTSIKSYYEGKVSAISASIKDLKVKVDASNKAHTVIEFGIAKEGKNDIDKAISSLDKQHAEYQKYSETRSTINKLENTTFKSAKEKVDKLNYNDYKANERFSNAHIATAISDFRTEARNNYVVDGAADKTPAADYNSGKCVTENRRIEGLITTWKDSALSAYNNYKSIYDAIAGYNAEIDGKKDDQTDIKAWSVVVLNENVTVNGITSTPENKQQTYAEAKAENDKVMNAAQTLLNTAMGTAKDKEADFAKNLETASAKSDVVNKATVKIQELKDNYVKVYSKWQANTNYQAAIDARSECIRLIEEQRTSVEALGDYTADKYGKNAANKLKDRKTNINGAIDVVAKKLETLNIPTNVQDFDEETAAKAIALINEIRADLDETTTDISKLKSDAAIAKTNFDEVMKACTNIKNQINGRPEAQNQTKINGIADYLVPATNSTITAAISTLDAKADAILADLNKSEDVAKDRKDDNKANPAVKGLDTRCEELLAEVTGYQDKAKNESANQTQKNAWDAFVANPDSEKDPAKVKDVQQIIDASITGVENAKAGETTVGEQYFLNEIAKKQTAYNTLVQEVGKIYGAKLPAPNGAYTDPAKNLAQAGKLEEKKQVLTALLADVKGYVNQAKANEEAYAAQTKYYNDVNDKFVELRAEISSSTPSGDKFTEAYNAALKELTALNDTLVSYKEYKDSKYAAGASVAFDGNDKNLVQIKKIEARIKDLKTLWNGSAETDGSYLKAITDDNAARYESFLDDVKKLNEAYYGKNLEGNKHVDGAIDIVAKLSVLSYANRVEPELYYEFVDGPNGLYSYANKIADLAKRAKENKEATKAPAFWDIEKAYAVQANDLKNEIDSKKNGYADKVNEVAKIKYRELRSVARNNVTDAIRSLINVGLAADNTAAEKLLDVEKSLLLGKGAISIWKAAEESYNYGVSAVDFAYRLDYEFIPGFEELEELFKASKDLAAKNAVEGMWNKVDVNADKAAMAKFYWNKDYSTVTDHTKFVQGTAPAEFKFSGVTPEYTFDKYAETKREYDGAVETRNLGTTDAPKMETHTKEYWVAYDSNEKYKNLKKADEALTAAQGKLNTELDKVEASVKILLIEHDATVVGLLEQFRKDIKDLSSADDETVKGINNKISAFNTTAIYKEMQAVIIELNSMLGYIELNLSDDNADKAKLVEGVNGLKKSNDDIYELFSVGKGTPVVKKTAAETYAAYIALEKEIGSLKLSYDATVNNGAAATEVQDSIDNLNKRYAELVKTFNGTYPQTQTAKKDEFDAIKPQIEAIESKVKAQGEAIAIEMSNNLKAVEKVNTVIGKLSQELEDYDQPYIDNNTFVQAQLALLDTYETKLAAVKEKGNGLQNKKALFKWDEEGNRIEVLYVDDEAEKIDAKINGTEENPKHGARYDLNQLINSVHTDSYVYAKRWAEYQVGNINSQIVSLEKEILKYDLDKESTIRVRTHAEDVKAEIEHRLLEGAKLRKTLLDDLDEVYYYSSERSQLDTYIRKEYYEYQDDEDNTQRHYLDLVKEHDDLMRKYAAIYSAIDAIKDRIVIPGAIENGKEITGTDIYTVVNFILEKRDPTDAEKHVADVNGNGIVDVADLQAIVNMYLYGRYNPKARNSAAPHVRNAGTLAMFANASNLNLTLDTEMAFTGIQLDVTLPEGVILTDAALASDMEGVVVKSNKIGENTWRVLAYSSANGNIIEGLDFLNISLAGKGTGVVSIDNVKGATTRGVLVSIPGAEESMNITTGVNATMAQAKAYIYGVDGKVRESIGKGINIVKDAAGKVKKVVGK